MSTQPPDGLDRRTRGAPNLGRDTQGERFQLGFRMYVNAIHLVDELSFMYYIHERYARSCDVRRCAGELLASLAITFRSKSFSK
jgi:hypothetical protein